MLVAKVLGARSSGRSADETEYGNFASDVSHQGPSGAAQEGFATEVWSVLHQLQKGPDLSTAALSRLAIE